MRLATVGFVNTHLCRVEEEVPLWGHSGWGLDRVRMGGGGVPWRCTLMYATSGLGQATAFALARWEGPGVLLSTKSPEGLES